MKVSLKRVLTLTVVTVVFPVKRIEPSNTKDKMDLNTGGSKKREHEFLSADIPIGIFMMRIFQGESKTVLFILRLDSEHPLKPVKRLQILFHIDSLLFGFKYGGNLRYTEKIPSIG